MRDTCLREIEIVASIVDRGRTDVDEADIEAHLKQCDACLEAAIVTRLMARDHDSTRHIARVPAAGQVWWRAAVRARLEAVHAAARPLTWSQGVAGACALGLTIGVIGLIWPAVRGAASWTFGYVLQSAPLGDAPALLGTTWRTGVLAMLVAAACLVVAPVVYFALSDE
jgi:hypothetical protein